MSVTIDDFSTYFFVPLLALGVWCLFEGGNRKALFVLIVFLNDNDEVGDVGVEATKIHLSICFQQLQFSARDARHGLSPTG